MGTYGCSIDGGKSFVWHDANSDSDESGEYL